MHYRLTTTTVPSWRRTKLPCWKLKNKINSPEVKYRYQEAKAVKPCIQKYMPQSCVIMKGKYRFGTMTIVLLQLFVSNKQIDSVIDLCISFLLFRPFKLESWRRKRLPTPVFWPGEFYRLYSPWGCQESDTTEWHSLPFTLKLRKQKKKSRKHRQNTFT